MIASTRRQQPWHRCCWAIQAVTRSPFQAPRGTAELGSQGICHWPPGLPLFFHDVASDEVLHIPRSSPNENLFS